MLLAVCLWAWMPQARADQLELRLQPDNEAARANVQAYLGVVEGRDEAGLRRYLRHARSEVRRALEALGYYQSRIRGEIQSGDTPRLILNITLGEPVRLANVDIRIEGEAGALREFIRPSGRRLQPGAALDHGAYEDAKRLIQNQALRLGFFQGRFTEQILKVDPQAGAADIRLVYDSGPRYRLGAVRFEGESPIGDALLERFVKFAPGTLYDADLLAAFNQDLIGSGYFAQVLVDAPREQAVEQVIPVIVQVSPRKPRTLGLGVGFSTDVGPRVRTTWQEHWVNDQGHRRGAEIEVSEPRQNLGLWYEFPLDPPTTDKFRLTSGFQREHIEDTDSRRLTLGGQWYTRLDNGWQQILSMRWEEERYAIGDLRGRSTLLLPGIGFTKTHSDQAIDPSRGYRLQLEVAGAQRTFLSDADILHVTALAKGLHTLGNGHRILGRAQVGLVGTNEFSAVPPSLRFFAGGDQSVRGYDYQSLSPRNAEGTVVGGRYLLVGSAEYQIPVAARWRVAAFVDEGNAIDSPRDPLQTGVGLGVRWVSPLGPLRLDLAYGLSESAGGGLRLHFSMGPEL